MSPLQVPVAHICDLDVKVISYRLTLEHGEASVEQDDKGCYKD